MIVVKIELWPNGNESKAREIGRMNIANDGKSTTLSRGDYDVWLMRRGTTDKVQKTARVEDYPRASYSVWRLIRLALDAVGV